MAKLKLMCSVLFLLVVSTAFSYAQMNSDAKSIGQVLDNRVGSTESEFVPAAEAMPEDKYLFAPSSGEFKGVRTFAQQVKHVAAVNYLIGASILGEKPPVNIEGENGPSNMTSKAEIVKFLKGSYAYFHKAVQSVNGQNAVADIKSPFGQGTTTRLGIAVLNIGHNFDHYGQIVEYLRMNGIVPPASR